MGLYDGFIEASLSGISFEVLTDPERSPKETFTDKGFEATIWYKVPWNDRVRFCQQILGGPAGKALILPARYLGFPPAVATNCDIEPMGKWMGKTLDGQQLWEAAKISVKFATTQWESQQQQVGEVLVSEGIEGAAEFLTLPANGLYWDAAKTQKLEDAEAPGKLYKTITWNYTLHHVNKIPADMWGWVGTVNSQKLKSLTNDFVWDEETLLFNPPQLRREITANQIRAWEVDLHLTYKKDTWNKFPRKGTTTCSYIYGSDGSIYKPYTPATWGKVFKVAT